MCSWDRLVSGIAANAGVWVPSSNSLFCHALIPQNLQMWSFIVMYRST